MLTCKNKIFSKFLFFSLFFVTVSFIINSVIVHAFVPPEKKRSHKKAVEIQVQQREILDHLERIENKMIISEKRNFNVD